MNMKKIKIDELFPGKPMMVIPEVNGNFPSTKNNTELVELIFQLTLFTSIFILAAYVLNDSEKKYECN